MAGSDLPFPNNARADNNTLFGGARLGRRKKTVFLILMFVVFFVLFFNFDQYNYDNTVETPVESSEKETKAPIIQDEVEEEEEDEVVEEESVPIIKPEPPKKIEPVEIKKPLNPSYQPPTTIYKPTPQHFKYFIVIASRASNLSRRQMIRKTYFGLEDNVEPCMKRDKGINYLFWVYGDIPSSRTPERRLYETEKMEWNDLEKVNKQAYNQDDMLNWVRKKK